MARSDSDDVPRSIQCSEVLRAVYLSMKKTITVRKNEDLFLPLIWTGEEQNLSYEVLLAEENAKIKLYMILVGKDSDLVNINIRIVHQKPSTISNVIVRGVLEDNSSVDFYGLVKIDKGSKLSNAWLGAHLLLLSKSASGRAVPSLEILENDIKAGHATTVGKVDEREIFYLMSRGISRKKARDLIIQGFLAGFLNEFPNNFQKDQVLKSLKYAI